MSSHAHENIILITDPRILAVKVQENHEPLIDLSQQNIILFGPSPEIPHNTDYTKLRITVYEKLKQAQHLLPPGLHLCLYEGYRSLELQKKLFDNRFAQVKSHHPDWPFEKIFIETTRLVSPVINLDGKKNVPPHCTGAAIDVYLVDDLGRPVEMGIHPRDWMTDLTGSLSASSSTNLSKDARKNRHIMAAVLTKVNFVNYPTEYWHWSYGDRYWAYAKNINSANYDCYH